MNDRNRTFITAILLAGSIVEGSAWAQTSQPAPVPPSQVCVNGVCVGSNSPGPGPGPGPGAGSPRSAHVIKWNPGHYMASGGVVSPGMTIANSPFLIWELGALNNRNAIIGYRMLIDWAAIEPTEGNYDFSQITAVENYLKTQLNVPKHLVLVVLPGYFGNKTCNGDVVPNYILNNSAYGKSPNTGSYGWWGGTGNGNTCSAAIWRSNVMDRWIALHQALGKAFDSDPFFETIMFQE